MTTSKQPPWPKEGRINWQRIAKATVPADYQTRKDPTVPRPARKTTTKKTPQKPAQAARKAPTPPKNRLDVAIDDPGDTFADTQGVVQHPQLPKVFEDATRSPEPSPCDVCGGPVAPDTRHDTFGPWRRHTECSGIVGAPHLRFRAAAAALAVANLTTEDASVIGYTVPLYSQTYDQWNRTGPKRRTRPTMYPPGTKTRDRMAWRHVDKAALAKAVKQVPRLRVEAGLDPAPCLHGVCAACGVVESVGWAETDLRWPNGQVAPMCGRCYAVFARHSEPSYVTEQKAVMAEIVTSVMPNVNEPTPDALMFFLDAGVEASGPEFPHLNPEAVEAYRWTVWSRRPADAPAAVRVEARRRHEAQQAEKWAHTQRQQEEEAARLEAQIGYGVG